MGLKYCLDKKYSQLLRSSLIEFYKEKHLKRRVVRLLMELALLGHYILRVLSRIHGGGGVYGLHGSSLTGKSISDTVQSLRTKIYTSHFEGLKHH